MTEGDEKYTLGVLTADMAAVKREVGEIKLSQHEIITKIDNFNAVTVERWEKRNSYVDGKLKDHEYRLNALEEARMLDTNSSWYKVLKFLDNSLVKAIGVSLFGVILIALLYYAQQSSEYGQIIKDMKAGMTNN